MSREMYGKKNPGEFPNEIELKLIFHEKDGKPGKVERIVYFKHEDLRYGTNPHQPAAVYGRDGLAALRALKTGKQGPSQTNYEDIDRALKIISMLDGEDAVCSMHKHINPCGVAKKKSPINAFIAAYNADRRAAFGATMAFNTPVDAELADKIMSTDFFEVVVAKEIDPKALEIFNSGDKYGRNKEIRIFDYAHDSGLLQRMQHFAEDKARLPVELKVLGDGRLIISEPYTSKFREPGQLMPAVAKTKEGKVLATSYRSPTEQEANDLLFAWHICAHTRSNGIVLAREGETVSIGTGQQERIGAIEQAIAKAHQKAGPNALQGSVIASDGFMPKPDNIEAIALEGITAVIQPGGSIEDKNIIELANKKNIAIVFTEERCFSHF